MGLASNETEMETDHLKIMEGLIRGAFRSLALVPRTWGEAAGRSLGRIWFAMDRKHRRIAEKNLRRAFPEKGHREIRRLARRVFMGIGQVPFEIGWSLTVNGRNFGRRFRVDGLHHLQTAYNRGNGVLTLTGHTGNWELLPLATAMAAGYPASIIYRPLDFAPLDRFFIDLRSRYGATMIPKAHSMRRVLKSLRRRELVGVLLDQNVDWYDGVFVDFFGHPACTNKGLALLAMKTGAPVVPGFLMREGRTFRAVFRPEIPLIRTGDRTKDIETNTQRYNDALEALIREYPDQWFWVHRRWKGKPYRPWPRQMPLPKRKKRGRRRR